MPNKEKGLKWLQVTFTFGKKPMFHLSASKSKPSGTRRGKTYTLEGIADPEKLEALWEAIETIKRVYPHPDGISLCVDGNEIKEKSKCQ